MRNTAPSQNELELAKSLHELTSKIMDDMEHLIDLIQRPASTQDQLWYPTPPDGSI